MSTNILPDGDSIGGCFLYLCVGLAILVLAAAYYHNATTDCPPAAVEEDS